MVDRKLVSVVDDDESIRESMSLLLRLHGIQFHAFASAEKFLSSDRVKTSDRLILDVNMPGMSGFQLQQELEQRRIDMRTIFITGHVDGQIEA